MIVNKYFFIRAIITSACCLVFLFFLIPKQTNEVLRPLDGLTRLRWQILGILLLIALTLIPSIVYQFLIAYGHEYKTLRNIVAQISGINLVGLTVLFVMIYRYRRKD